MSGKLALIIGLGLFAMTGLLIYSVVQSSSSSTLIPSPQPTVVEEGQPPEAEQFPPEDTMMEQNPEADLLEIIVQDEETKRGVLNDVTGGTSGGVGYVLRSDDMLSHAVTADLPELEGDTFYEGWLVQQEPQLAFISTGEMEQQEDGTFSLTYTDENLYEGYNVVVITLETVRDETPEEHIIEGTVE